MNIHTDTHTHTHSHTHTYIYIYMGKFIKMRHICENFEISV